VTGNNGLYIQASECGLEPRSHIRHGAGNYETGLLIFFNRLC
jgi:hypothetical protein